MIIAISGRIGSGKTTLANAVSDRMGAKVAGFGDFVRTKARAQGLDVSDRRVLQDIGQNLVAADAVSFLDEALSWAGHKTGSVLVLDGLRHASVWDALVARQTDGLEQTRLVYLVIEERERRRRLLDRGLTERDIAAADAHPAEQSLNLRLRGAADFLIYATSSLDEMVQAVVAHVMKPSEHALVKATADY
jgi:dephospho-CoA kinase